MDVMEHEVWIDADSDRVYSALTTVEGLDACGVPVVHAEPRIGTVVAFDHGLGEPLREVSELVPGERVVWRCVSAFRDPTKPGLGVDGADLHLAPRGTVELRGTKHAVTVLRLRITGCAPDARWYGFCKTGWGETLAGSLKPSCERP